MPHVLSNYCGSCVNATKVGEFMCCGVVNINPKYTCGYTCPEYKAKTPISNEVIKFEDSIPCEKCIHKKVCEYMEGSCRFRNSLSKVLDVFPNLDVTIICSEFMGEN